MFSNHLLSMEPATSLVENDVIPVRIVLTQQHI